MIPISALQSARKQHKKRSGALHLTFNGRQNGAMQGLFAEKSDVVSSADLHPHMSLTRGSGFGSAKVGNSWEKRKNYFKEVCTGVFSQGESFLTFVEIVNKWAINSLVATRPQSRVETIFSTNI